MAKPDLRDHRKFLKLRRLAGEPIPHLMGYLDCLWLRGYQTGNPFIGDALDIEGACEYPTGLREPGKFAEMLLESGFIETQQEGKFVIHDLWDHAPAYVKKRMQRNGFAPKSSQTGAERQKTIPNGSGNAENCAARDTETKPKTRDEAERQEPKPKPKEEEDGGGADQTELWGAGPIKLDHRSGTWEGVTTDQRSIWAKAYPAVELDADLAKAAAWCVANPREGRKSNYARFLTNWLSRTQDSGGNRVRGSPTKASLHQQIVDNGSEFIRLTGGAS